MKDQVITSPEFVPVTMPGVACKMQVHDAPAYITLSPVGVDTRGVRIEPGDTITLKATDKIRARKAQKLAPVMVFEAYGPDMGVINYGITPIDSVVIMGASLEFAVFGNDLTTPHALSTSLLTAAGHALPVYGRAVSGVTLGDAVAQYNSARAARPNSLIVMDLGGNNVTSGRPYPGGEATIRAQLADLLLVAKNDKNFYPTNLTFRDYGDVTFQDPSLGSKPYNENIFHPWIAEHFPHAMASYGRPKLDLYRKSLSVHETWLSADNVHFTAAGNTAYREYLMERVADLLNGVTPAQIEERVYVAPPPPPVSELGALSIINFASSTSPAAGYNNIRGTTDGVIQMALAEIKDVDGGLTSASLAVTVPAGVALGSLTNPAIGAGSNGRNTAPAYNKQLLAGEITVSAYFVTPGATATFTLSGLAPGGIYEIGVVGSRAATDTRISQLTVQGSLVEWNACEDPAQERKVTVTADAQGKIASVLAAKAGSPFGYLSGLSFKRL